MLRLWLVLATIGLTSGREISYHPHYAKMLNPQINLQLESSGEHTSKYWIENAQKALEDVLRRKQNKNVAKNVILFLGDGMSVPTLAATRMYLGQKEGKSGEETILSFEKFPSVGLSKTYCVDSQIADSACTSTAYLTGVKANQGTAGVTASVQRGDCEASLLKEHHTESIASWALEANKDAGIVTTTRITHASPSGAYAHIADRDWEYDAPIRADGHDPVVCPDIADQLINNSPGFDFKVILGGGRRYFLPTGKIDEEGDEGSREDGRNLITEWKEYQNAMNRTHSYIWHRDQVKDFKYDDSDYVLGLFESDHLRYNLLTNLETEPTLEELTEMAIRKLSSSENGFFLFVEGGRIDHAHHENRAQLALEETVEFHKAIQKAVDLTSEEDTLIVVTSDHAHVMTINGYSPRGNNILGPSADIGKDNVPYLTLGYTNGPGFRQHEDIGMRKDVTLEDYYDPMFQYPADIHLDSETHGGDDVAIFAHGPFSHLFTGVHEQHNIPHLMAYAACIGPGLHACDHE